MDSPREDTYASALDLPAIQLVELPVKSIHPQTGFLHWLEQLSLPAISKELPLSHGKNVTVNALL